VSRFVLGRTVGSTWSHAKASCGLTSTRQNNYLAATLNPLTCGFTTRPQTNSDTVIATGPDGTQYAIPISFPLGKYNMQRYAPKIAPSIVQRRVALLKVTIGKRSAIRGSPWRINLICQFLAGKTAPDALSQLAFVQKARAPLMYKVLKTTVDNARIQHGLVPSQLEVTQCFATPATPLKRLKIMGRGRSGKKIRRFTHVRLILREIDFPLKILSATSLNQRQMWIHKMNLAVEDARAYAVERQEMERLEQQVKQIQQDKIKKDVKK
jgi:large subunit ribosomal protein L22